MTAPVLLDTVEAARREWRARLDAFAAHTGQCDAYVVDKPCAGCDLFLSREQAAYTSYYRLKSGGRR